MTHRCLIDRRSNRASAAWTAVLVLAALAVHPAFAADDPPPAPAYGGTAVPDALGPARAAIGAKRWDVALAELRKVNATGNADWNNLMGYALRKQARPDLDGAQRFYDAALRIDPRHKGALSYTGELALTRGNLPLAEQRLAALRPLCPGGCKEVSDLELAIHRFKAEGSRRP
jgi:hypothetical protein